MPRHLRGTTVKTFLIKFCAGWLPARQTARGVLVFHFRAAGFELLHRHQNALQNVQRLETGDDNRHAVFFHQRKIFLVAHHRADVAGGEKRLHAAVRATTSAPQLPAARGRAKSAARSFSNPFCAAWKTAMAVAGAVVSKPTPKKTTSRAGFSSASFTASSGE